MQVSSKAGKFHFFHKFTAIFLSISFTLLDLVQYAPKVSAQTFYEDQIKQLNPQGLNISSELGTVEESHKGNLNKTIFYIQDAHDSLEAQEHISKLINQFVKEKKVKTIFEEGYEGAVPTDKFFGFIKNPKIKEKVSYFLLDKLRIGAAEYAHINRTQDFKLIGVEKLNLYHQNIKWYQKASEKRKITEEDLDELLKHITQLANQYFPRDLKAWLKLKERFTEGKFPLLDYIKQTQVLFLKVIPQNAFVQRYLLITLILEAQGTKDSQVINQLKSLQSKEVFKELSDLEQAFSVKLIQNERDQIIFKSYQDLSLLKRLNQIELTQEEYEAVKESIKAVRTEGLLHFIVDNTHKPLVLSKTWERNIKDAVQFYEVAQQRDQMIDSHIKEFIQNPNEDTAVLVFGGFHSIEIKEILKREGLNYFVISPKITSTDKQHQAYYKQLMSTGQHSFETSFQMARAAKPESTFSITAIWGEERIRSELRIIASVVENFGERFDPIILNRRIESQLMNGNLPKPILQNITFAKSRSEVRMSTWSPFWKIPGRISAFSDGPFKNGYYVDEMKDIFDKLAGEFPSGSKVLHLGSGNGADMEALRLAGENSRKIFQSYGIDQAETNPPSNFRNANMYFYRMSGEQLNFKKGFFDGFVSIYGLEYMDREAALRELFRVLGKGKGIFLMHTKDSYLIQGIEARQKELEGELRFIFPKFRDTSGRIFELAKNLVHARKTSEEKNINEEFDRQIVLLTQKNINQIASGTSAGILGHVINELPFIVDSTRDQREAEKRIQELKEKVLFEWNNLSVLYKKALSLEDLNSLVRLAEKIGFKNVSVEPFNVQKSKRLGWILKMEKSNAETFDLPVDLKTLSLNQMGSKAEVRTEQMQIIDHVIQILKKEHGLPQNGGGEAQIRSYLLGSDSNLDSIVDNLMNILHLPRKKIFKYLELAKKLFDEEMQQKKFLKFIVDQIKNKTRTDEELLQLLFDIRPESLEDRQDVQVFFIRAEKMVALEYTIKDILEEPVEEESKLGNLLIELESLEEQSFPEAEDALDVLRSISFQKQLPIEVRNAIEFTMRVLKDNLTSRAEVRYVQTSKKNLWNALNFSDFNESSWEYLFSLELSKHQLFKELTIQYFLNELPQLKNSVLEVKKLENDFQLHLEWKANAGSADKRDLEFMGAFHQIISEVTASFSDPDSRNRWKEIAKQNELPVDIQPVIEKLTKKFLFYYAELVMKQIPSDPLSIDYYSWKSTYLIKKQLFKHLGLSNDDFSQDPAFISLVEYIKTIGLKSRRSDFINEVAIGHVMNVLRKYSSKEFNKEEIRLILLEIASQIRQPGIFSRSFDMANADGFIQNFILAELETMPEFRQRVVDREDFKSLIQLLKTNLSLINQGHDVRKPLLQKYHSLFSNLGIELNFDEIRRNVTIMAMTWKGYRSEARAKHPEHDSHAELRTSHVPVEYRKQMVPPGVFPRIFLSQPRKGEYEEQPLESKVQPLSDIKNEMISNAFGYLERRIALNPDEDMRNNLTKDLELLRDWISVIGVDLPTLFFTKGEEDKDKIEIDQILQISYRRKSITLPIKFLERFNPTNQQDQAKVAFYLLIGAQLIGYYYQMLAEMHEEEISHGTFPNIFPDIYKEVDRKLRNPQFINDLFSLLGIDFESFQDKMKKLKEEDQHLRTRIAKSFKESEDIDKEKAERIENILADWDENEEEFQINQRISRAINQVNQLDSSEVGKRSSEDAKETIERIINGLEKDAFYEEITGHQEQVPKIYESILKLHKDLQKIDPVGYYPIRVQWKILYFLLRLGDIQGFNEEFDRLLAAEYVPRIFRDSQLDLQGVKLQDEPQTLLLTPKYLADWLEDALPDMLLRLQWYASFVSDPDELAKAELIEKKLTERLTEIRQLARDPARFRRDLFSFKTEGKLVNQGKLKKPFLVSAVATEPPEIFGFTWKFWKSKYSKKIHIQIEIFQYLAAGLSNEPVGYFNFSISRDSEGNLFAFADPKSYWSKNERIKNPLVIEPKTRDRFKGIESALVILASNLAFGSGVKSHFDLSKLDPPLIQAGRHKRKVTVIRQISRDNIINAPILIRQRIEDSDSVDISKALETFLSSPIELSDEEAQIYFKGPAPNNKRFFLKKLHPQNDVHFINEWIDTVKHDLHWQSLRMSTAGGHLPEFPRFRSLVELNIGLVSKDEMGHEHLEGHIGLWPIRTATETPSYQFVIPQFELYYRNIGRNAEIKGVADLLLDFLIKFMSSQKDFKGDGISLNTAGTPGGITLADRRGMKIQPNGYLLLSQQKIEELAPVLQGRFTGRRSEARNHVQILTAAQNWFTKFRRDWQFSGPYEFATGMGVNSVMAEDVISRIIRSTSIFQNWDLKWTSIWEKEANRETDLLKRFQMLYISLGYLDHDSKTYIRLSKEMRELFPKVIEEEFLNEGRAPPSIKPVQIPFSSHQEIPGILFLPPGISLSEKIPAQLILHGLTQTKEQASFIPLILENLRENKAVLVIDLPGHGENFESMDGPAEFIGIVRASLDFLKQNPNVDEKHLSAVGFSFGGYGIIRALDDQNNHDLEAVFSINPPARNIFQLHLKTLFYLWTQLEFLSQMFGVPSRRWIPFKFLWTLFKLNSFALSRAEIAALNGLGKKIKIIVGEKDSLIPKADQNLFNGLDVWNYPDQGHYLIGSDWIEVMHRIMIDSLGNRLMNKGLSTAERITVNQKLIFYGRKISSPPVEKLAVSILKNSDDTIALGLTAGILAVLGNPKELEVLQPFTNSTNPFVRKQVERAIYRIENRKDERDFNLKNQSDSRAEVRNDLNAFEKQKISEFIRRVIWRRDELQSQKSDKQKEHWSKRLIRIDKELEGWQVLGYFERSKLDLETTNFIAYLRIYRLYPDLRVRTIQLLFKMPLDQMLLRFSQPPNLHGTSRAEARSQSDDKLKNKFKVVRANVRNDKAEKITLSQRPLFEEEIEVISQSLDRSVGNLALVAKELAGLYKVKFQETHIKEKDQPLIDYQFIYHRIEILSSNENNLAEKRASLIFKWRDKIPSKNETNLVRNFNEYKGTNPIVLKVIEKLKEKEKLPSDNDRDLLLKVIKTSIPKSEKKTSGPALFSGKLPEHLADFMTELGFPMDIFAAQEWLIALNEIHSSPVQQATRSYRHPTFKGQNLDRSEVRVNKEYMQRLFEFLARKSSEELSLPHSIQPKEGLTFPLYYNRALVLKVRTPGHPSFLYVATDQDVWRVSNHWRINLFEEGNNPDELTEVKSSNLQNQGIRYFVTQKHGTFRLAFRIDGNGEVHVINLGEEELQINFQFIGLSLHLWSSRAEVRKDKQVLHPKGRSEARTVKNLSQEDLASGALHYAQKFFDNLNTYLPQTNYLKEKAFIFGLGKQAENVYAIDPDLGTPFYFIQIFHLNKERRAGFEFVFYLNEKKQKLALKIYELSPFTGRTLLDSLEDSLLPYVFSDKQNAFRAMYAELLQGISTEKLPKTRAEVRSQREKLQKELINLDRKLSELRSNLLRGQVATLRDPKRREMELTRMIEQIQDLSIQLQGYRPNYKVIATKLRSIRLGILENEELSRKILKQFVKNPTQKHMDELRAVLQSTLKKFNKVLQDAENVRLQKNREKGNFSYGYVVDHGVREDGSIVPFKRPIAVRNKVGSAIETKVNNSRSKFQFKIYIRKRPGSEEFKNRLIQKLFQEEWSHFERVIKEGKVDAILEEAADILEVAQAIQSISSRAEVRMWPKAVKDIQEIVYIEDDRNYTISAQKIVEKLMKIRFLNQNVKLISFEHIAAAREYLTSEEVQNDNVVRVIIQDLTVPKNSHDTDFGYSDFNGLEFAQELNLPALSPKKHFPIVIASDGILFAAEEKLISAREAGQIAGFSKNKPATIQGLLEILNIVINHSSRAEVRSEQLQINTREDWIKFEKWIIDLRQKKETIIHEIQFSEKLGNRIIDLTKSQAGNRPIAHYADLGHYLRIIYERKFKNVLPIQIKLITGERNRLVFSRAEVRIDISELIEKMPYHPDWLTPEFSRTITSELPVLFKDTESLFATAKPYSGSLSHVVFGDNASRDATKIVRGQSHHWFDWARLKSWGMGSVVPGKGIWTNIGVAEVPVREPILNIKFSGLTLKHTTVEKVKESINVFLNYRLIDVQQDEYRKFDLSPYLFDLLLSHFGIGGIEIHKHEPSEQELDWLIIKNQNAIQSMKLLKPPARVEVRTNFSERSEVRENETVSVLQAEEIIRQVRYETQPVNVFVNAEDFNERNPQHLSPAQKNEYLYVALTRSKLRLIVYGVGQVHNKELDQLLKLDHVSKTNEDFIHALKIYSKPNVPNLHFSKAIHPSAELVHKLRQVIFFKQHGDKSGTLAVALLSTFSEESSWGISQDKDGFRTVTEGLVEIQNSYNQDLVFAWAA